MIEFRPLNFSSLVDLTQVLSDLEVQAFDYSKIELQKIHAFVVLDGGRTIGLCLYDFLKPDLALMRLIFISPSFRGLKLGDGLLRSTLNSIEIHGGNAVIFEGGSEELSFYLHEGMTSLIDVNDEEMARVKAAYSTQSARLYAFCSSIASFFDKPCKGGSKH